MIKVVSFKICPFVQRVTALLEAKHIPYEVEFIDLKNKPQWFLDISPNAQVPVLISDSGTPLFESDAIVEYLEEAYEPLEENVEAEQKALDRAWSYLASKNYLVQCSTMRSPDSATLEERSHKLREAFSKVEQALGHGPFFKGGSLSNVDIAWLPLLHRAYIIEKHSGYDLLARHPKVKAWQASLMATGLPDKSVPGDFEQAFTSFYLSEQTYLGSGADCTVDPNSQCGGSRCCA
jgi:glutathione S-transferase